MHIIVFGATGKTGIEIVKQAIEEGHHVTAFVRDLKKLAITHANLKVTRGDVMDLESLDAAMKGQEGVLCALGAGSSLKKTTIRTTGTRHILASMKKHDVKRLLVVSAMGIGESWHTLSFFNKLFLATLLKNTRADHEAQEKLVKDSTLDWTIVRPSGLVDTPKSDDYVVGEAIRAKNSKISRADVASLMLKIMLDQESIGKALTITKA